MGIRCETSVNVSQRLLAHHGGLRGLLRLDVAELARVRGLGDAKAVRVKAALELGRRLAALAPDERPPVGSPEDVATLLGIEMAALEQEQLRVVLLDTKHRILGTRTVYQGSVNHDREAGCWEPSGPGHGQGDGFPPTRSFTPQDDTLLRSRRHAFNPVHRCAPPPQGRIVRIGRRRGRRQRPPKTLLCRRPVRGEIAAPGARRCRR